MKWLTAAIRLQSAFGSPPKGDMLFGQLCWAIVHRWGESRLEELLDGYLDDSPFLVVSDALPSGFVPRPELPTPRLDPSQRKAARKERYFSTQLLAEPIGAVADSQAAAGEPFQRRFQPHNSISRLTGTTGTGHDPYQMERLWPRAPCDDEEACEFEVHCVIDEARFSSDDLGTVLADVGTFGFGRDASIGLGRFEVGHWKEGRPNGAKSPQGLLTLAPSSHPPGSLDDRVSYYRPFTRFGRHGAQAATSANPFKQPLLLMDSGAVLCPSRIEGLDRSTLFLGQGLGGAGKLSSIIPQTVHQGYAPVIPITLDLPSHVGRAA